MEEVAGAEGEVDVDVEGVTVEGDEVLVPHLQTICKTHKRQEAVEEWHILG
jgi:hypothetical protein